MGLAKQIQGNIKLENNYIPYFHLHRCAKRPPFVHVLFSVIILVSMCYAYAERDA